MNKYKIRADTRKKERAPIQVLTSYDFNQYRKNKFYYSPAEMYNRGENGIYFEIAHALQPSTNISIRVEKEKSGAKQHSEAYRVHRGRVKWCKTVEDQKGKRYGVGVEILETVVQAEIQSSHFDHK